MSVARPDPIPIASLDDPRIAVFRNLKDKELAASADDLFIAEGETLVRRLLASPFPIHSILVTEKRASDLAPLVPPDIPLYVSPEKLIHAIIGFKFHSGVIGCGRRLPPPSLSSILSRSDSATLVVIPEVNNLENLGSLIRISAAFGATALVLGEHCADPFWRRSIRVSMGAVFSLPIIRSANLTSDLRTYQEQWGGELIAAVCDPSAQPLSSASRPKRLALLFGQEGPGLSPAYVSACDRSVTIPMHYDTDSLNVAIAAAVFLYHFTSSPQST